MKKLLLSFAAAALVLLPCTSPAADLTGLYIAPKFALNVQHSAFGISAEGDSASLGSETEPRAGGALAIGYDFAPKFDVPVRAELEYGAYGNVSRIKTAENNVSFKSTSTIQTLLANVYWDIAEWNGFTPYVGVGAGVAFVKTEGKFRLPADVAQRYPELSAPWRDTDTVFAGQAGLGVSYAFSESVSADLGYRFLATGDGSARRESVTLKAKDNYMHQVMLGLRVTF